MFDLRMVDQKRICDNTLVLSQLLYFNLAIINFRFIIIDNLFKLSFKKFDAFMSFSINVTFLASLEIHSIPKEPIPEYKSKTFEFLIMEL